MAGMDMGLGMPPDAGDSGNMSDLGAESDETGFEPKTDEEREAMSALDPDAPMADRVASLLEAIRLCSEKDYGAEESGVKKKPGIDIAMVFGGPKKKG